MKVEIKVTKEVDIRYLLINAKVRYFENATINGIEDIHGTLTPCKVGDYWKPTIDIDKGIIRNWEIGTEADIHFKVVDEGSYYLTDEFGELILSIENDYVPNIACPEGNGYGDYIIMKIDKEGKIANWRPTIDEFLEEN